MTYRERPTLRNGAENSGWGEWLVDDQRYAASRTDVLVYQTEPLREPVRLAGEPIANLFASTSGTDSDWVVKIIDVWPDEVQERPTLGGYQQMLSADIFRGRYRTDFAKPQPLTPNKALEYRIRAAEREPHVPAGPSHHGADPVQLVSAVRPQSADFRAEHHVREPGDLREGHPAGLACAGTASAIELPVQ